MPTLKLESMVTAFVELTAMPTVLAAGKYMPFAGAVEPVTTKEVPLTDRPAVRLAIDTCLVALL
jgi:hypothetical protein